MSLIKLNNRAVKDVTQFGSITSLGSLTHISTATASSSASIEFTSGIDSTYKEYVFYFVDIHPATDGANLVFNFSTDSGSTYNVAKTTTTFRAVHFENDSTAVLGYFDQDLAQGTGDQRVGIPVGSDNDQSGCGYMHLYNPSSTTFVKHFTIVTNSSLSGDASINFFTAGYGNTTSAIDSIRFQMSSGNIDAGQILLFGVN
jgi:hypothetical protein